MRNTWDIGRKPIAEMESSDWLVNWRQQLALCMSVGTIDICPNSKYQPIRLKNNRDMGKKPLWPGPGKRTSKTEAVANVRLLVWVNFARPDTRPDPEQTHREKNEKYSFLPISRLFFNRFGWYLECGQILVVPTDMQVGNRLRQLTSQSELSIFVIGLWRIAQVFFNRFGWYLECGQISMVSNEISV